MTAPLHSPTIVPLIQETTIFRYAALLPFAASIVVPAAAAEKRATGVMTDKGKLTMFEGQKFEGDSVGGDQGHAEHLL